MRHPCCSPTVVAPVSDPVVVDAPAPASNGTTTKRPTAENNPTRKSPPPCAENSDGPQIDDSESCSDDEGEDEVVRRDEENNGTSGPEVVHTSTDPPEREVDLEKAMRLKEDGNVVQTGSFVCDVNDFGSGNTLIVTTLGVDADDVIKSRSRHLPLSPGFS